MELALRSERSLVGECFYYSHGRLGVCLLHRGNASICMARIIVFEDEELALLGHHLGYNNAAVCTIGTSQDRSLIIAVSSTFGLRSLLPHPIVQPDPWRENHLPQEHLYPLPLALRGTTKGLGHRPIEAPLV